MGAEGAREGVCEMTGWIECDDPERLAAAAAAGVAVELAGAGGSWLRCAFGAAQQFERGIEQGGRYRIPSRVVWPPETLVVPEGMTPERLRKMAGDVGSLRLRRSTAGALLRWADDLVAQIEGGGAVGVAMVDGEPVEQWRWDALRAELAAALAGFDAITAKLAAYPEVPDGCEVLVVPSKTVDWYAERATEDQPDPHSPKRDLIDAARAAVARRPKPEPRTERVDWTDVVVNQRRLTLGPRVGGVRYGTDGCLAYTDCEGVLIANVHDPRIGWDGSNTVEVLVEDGES